MRFSTVFLGAVLLVATAMPVMSHNHSFERDVTLRALDSSDSVDEVKEDEIKKCQQDVDNKKKECDPLTDKSKAAKEKFKELAKKESDKNNECKKLKNGAEKNECIKARNEAREDKKEAQKAHNDLQKASKSCQKEVTNLLKKLRGKKKRKVKRKKATKKIKTKTKKDKTKKKKKKAPKEVKAELVAGQCVADHQCASLRGDPHVTSFDGLKYDCQGEGEFVLIKTINSESTFEVQGRFTDVKKDQRVSITTAISIDTGYEGEPDVDVFTEKVDGQCVLYYYVDGVATDFSTAVPGISFEGNGDKGTVTSDYLFFTSSGFMFTTYAKDGMYGCVLNSKFCLPPSMVDTEDIVGLLGTPDGLTNNEWTTPSGAELSQANMDKAHGYAMCTKNWCVRSAEQSIFGYLEGTSHSTYMNCDATYSKGADDIILDPPEECVTCCEASGKEENYDDCLLECALAGADGVEQCVIDIEDTVVLADVEKKCKDPVVPTTPTDPGTVVEDKVDPYVPPEEQPEIPEEPEEEEPEPEEPEEEEPEEEEPETRTISFPTNEKEKNPASSSGDPHFKTWTGEKYDYHGECDLVLIDHPSFGAGMGLKVYIRTTRVKYFSYIEQIVVQINGKVLEFNNDVNNFMISYQKVEAPKKYQETKFAGFVVRRDPKALSIRLDESGAKIDLIQRANGFPAVVLDAAGTDIFKGSLGLLGDFTSGKKLARDGETEIEDPTEFALEWQVRDTEPLLFSSARFPQFPTQCTPPKKILGNRLGLSHMQEEAEKVCAAWKTDKEDCIFDVIATRDVLAASEGSVVA